MAMRSAISGKTLAGNGHAASPSQLAKVLLKHALLAVSADAKRTAETVQDALGS
jgi:hypothetical protein